MITTEPDDAKEMFRYEGKLPNRPAFPALLHYRWNTFKSIGVVPGNGEEWYKFRGGINPLLKPNLVALYTKKHIEIADDFVKYIQNMKNNKEILEDLFSHLLKYTIEGKIMRDRKVIKVKFVVVYSCFSYLSRKKIFLSIRKRCRSN